MSQWQQHLPDAAVRAMRNELIGAGLAKDNILDAMMSNISAQYSGSLPGFGLPPNMRLLQQLNAMNKVANLRNGDVPLAQWLRSAKELAGELPVGETLDKALLDIEQGVSGTAPTLAALGGGDGGGQLLNTELEATVGGMDETLSINYLKGGLETAGSVFKLLVHRFQDGHPEFASGDTPRLIKGTGWMIGPGLMVTNHHVVNGRDKRFEDDASDIDFKLQAEHIDVLYDYHEQDKPSHTVSTEAGALIAFNKELDFAILRLPAAAPSRPALRLRKHLIRKRPEQPMGTRVNVLQHPNGNPMRLGFRDNFVTRGHENLLCYLTDTQAGSSGSPVCDDTWSVAALHAGTQALANQVIEIRGKKIRKENYGTPVPTLIQTLKDHHPNLHAEIVNP